MRSIGLSTIVMLLATSATQAQQSSQPLAAEDVAEEESLDLSGRNVRDHDLGVLRNARKLKRLNLKDTGVTNAGLRVVAELTTLEELRLGGTAPELGNSLDELVAIRAELDEVFAAIAPHLDPAVFRPLPDRLGSVQGGRVAQLRTRVAAIRPGSGSISDAGMRNLQYLKSLTTLDIVDTQVGSAGLYALRGLTSLKTLKVGRSDSGTGNSEIIEYGPSKLKGLGVLSKIITQGFARQTEVDRLARKIDEFQRNDKLWTSGYRNNAVRSDITIAGIRNLRTLPNLEELELANVSVNDGVFESLRAMPKLREVVFDNTTITSVAPFEVANYIKLLQWDMDFIQLICQNDGLSIKVRDALLQKLDRGVDLQRPAATAVRVSARGISNAQKTSKLKITYQGP